MHAGERAGVNAALARRSLTRTRLRAAGPSASAGASCGPRARSQVCRQLTAGVLPRGDGAHVQGRARAGAADRSRRERARTHPAGGAISANGSSAVASHAHSSQARSLARRCARPERRVRERAAAACAPYSLGKGRAARHRECMMCIDVFVTYHECVYGHWYDKQALHSVLFGRNRKLAAVMVRCGPAFAAHASGGPMSDAPEFGRIRVRVRVWAQALSGMGASRERVCATMQQKIVPRSIAQPNTAGCGF